MNKTNHNATVGANEVMARAALERGGRSGAVAVVRDFAGVVGNGVSRARWTTFLSMLLREGVLVPVPAAGFDGPAADFLPVGFLAGGGEGAALGSFFWRLRMSFPRSSSALL